MDHTTKICEVMTSYPVVVDVRDPISVAHELMVKHGIRHLPVLSNGLPISVLSEREINSALALGQESSLVTVGDLCALEGYMVDIDHLLVDVLENMYSKKLGSVLVTSKGRVAGIFTAVDACRELMNLLQGPR